MAPPTRQDFETLGERFDGELRIDSLARKIYSTDASVYQEIPAAVATPKTEDDIRRLIEFANLHQIGLIPRTAGTSLAGQVVGSGIVVDVSRHFTEMIEIDRESRWVRVQPGVIRNELNMALRPHGLLFGPETSTQNRAMIGGMVGNNSCGSNSIVYGSTRDHLIEVRGFLSDGSEATFRALDETEYRKKCDPADRSLEAQIYRGVRELLADQENREEIVREFPKPEIPRRNTGYAVDLLMDASPLAPESKPSDQPFNFCKLIAGSEGTLFFATEIKLHCLPLPPPVSGLQCAHFDSIDDALQATLIAVQHKAYACELIDRFILEGANRNIEQRQNMSFVQGDPAAILVTELRGESVETLQTEFSLLESELADAGLGYHYPVLFGKDTQKVWDLRKVGLGVVSNVPGDAKPVAVIEDAAVAVEDLPEYIGELNRRMKDRFGLECVHYAHAGTGEIHLRPIMNLKTEVGQRQFRELAAEVAGLVKKYRGSLSGEHGDGRLRSEFLEQMIGEKNFEIIRQIKQLWDPANIFNPGKLVDSPIMNSALRYQPNQETKQVQTVFDFGETQGVLRAAELCNGSGECRKTELTGGTMCPSYMATRAEQDSTRARANVLRHVLTESADQQHPFDSEEVKQVMDLCLSCKACKRECPSNVDMAKLKAEFLQGYYDANGVPRRTRLIANFARSSQWASHLPWLYNLAVRSSLVAPLLKRIAGFAPQRSLPTLGPRTLRRWFASHVPHANAGRVGKVFLFCDEFTNFNDTAVGIAAIELLERLGYQVRIPDHRESGRAAISKGLLRQAKSLAEQNVRSLHEQITEESPMVGIEPSAILSFRDEYLDLVGEELREPAQALAGNSLMIDEFVDLEIEKGNISPDQFTDAEQVIRLHGHCHQKALASLAPTVRMLQLPRKYQVRLIPSGCCGMAGSFGYEREHYEISMQIGELVLFPTLRQESEEVLIAAPGTSCRHQIADGTGRSALHPVQILRQALTDR